MSGGADGDDDADKQYDATQKKLDDARKKGEVPHSADLTTAAAYSGFLLAAVAAGPAAMASFGTAMSVLLEQADTLSEDAFAGTATPLVGGLIWRIVVSQSPWLALPAAVALLAVLAQRSLVFAPSKLAPKLSRISLIKSIGHKFGRTGLFEFAKSTAKLIIYSIVLGIYLLIKLPDIVVTARMAPGPVAVELLHLSIGLLFIVLLVAFALGGIDALWQHAEHRRKHMMSHKELRDEARQSEGDPAIKQQRRQRGVSLAMNRMLADVPKADVVIVNPTHFAVALQWDRAPGTAPVCVAKGVDEIAHRIREIAAVNGVPVHSDPPTARALYAGVALGQEIAPDHYRAVAAAIRFAEGIGRKARGA